MMVQSGLLVPVHPDSAFGLFKSILTDIGDNQSIENQLSSYSYRLNRMKGFLQAAGRNSLLLLDEFGTGSDPELGGALAEVFFEELYEKRMLWCGHHALRQHQDPGDADATSRQRQHAL